VDDPLEQRFTLLFNTVRTVRNLRAEAGIKPGQRIETILESDNPEERQILRATADYLKDLGKIDTLVITGGSPASPPPESPSLSNLENYPLVSGVRDFWKTMMPLFDQPLDYLSEFLSDLRRPAFTLLWVLVGAIVLKLASGVATAIDHTPLFGSLMELVGLYYTLTLVRRHLLTKGDRQQLQHRLGHWWAEVSGADQPSRSQSRVSLPVAVGLGDSNNGNNSHGVSPTPKQLQEQPPEQRPAQRQLFAGVTGTVQVLIPLTGLVDIAALQTKLTKDLSKIEAEIQSLSGRLNNPGFVDKAPETVVQGARQALAEAQTQATILQSRLQRL
jgi:valyl-tRNA synthetase